MTGQLRVIIDSQWKAGRPMLLALAFAALALPLASVQQAWGDGSNLPQALAELQLWSYFYPALALVSGLGAASLTWGSDRRGGFVYAAVLPLSRPRYALLRWLAGSALLLALSMAMLAAAGVAVLLADVPEVLRVFPIRLALKFLLAAVMIFGLASAHTLAAPPIRRALVWAASLWIVAMLITGITDTELNLGGWTWRLLTRAPGPLAPFGGRWMLIDV